MPWRGHPDPYAVWVSEIMLQQTQVATATPYFERFIQAFPDIPSLASAPVTKLLKLWEGLGYYTRAHNLQKAAKILLAEHNGKLPATPAELEKLPGIGPYTAAAIASICFNHPTPVVDGNVARVFARYLAWPDDFKTTAALKKLRDWLTPHIRSVSTPGDFNQAMMELGSLVCTPTNPACGKCPLSPQCAAFKNNAQQNFPVKPAAKKPPVRHFAALLLRDEKNRVLLSQRTGERLLPGLWELPCGECPRPATSADAKKLFASLFKTPAPAFKRGPLITHAFSHFKQSLRVFQAEANGNIRPPLKWVSDPSTFPLTTTTRRALAKK